VCWCRLASLKALIANKSPMELQAALSLMFSSPMCMNASFLAVRNDASCPFSTHSTSRSNLRPPVQANHMDTGEVDPGVDLNAVREAYSAILAHVCNARSRTRPHTVQRSNRPFVDFLF
jgi:hypothetical protein